MRRHGWFGLMALALLLPAGCAFEDQLAAPADTGALTPQPDTGGLTPGQDVLAPDVPVVPAVPVTIGTSPVTSDPDAGLQILHLTWQQKDAATTATVQWRTELEGNEDYLPKVWFAREDEVTIEGDNVTMPYDEAHVVARPAARFEFSNWFQFFHFAEVELTGLQPGTKYYYRAGTWDELDEDSGQLTNVTISKLHSFRTGLTKGDASPFTFVAAGDSRTGYDKIRLEAPRLHDIGADFWLFNGDMTSTGTAIEWLTWFDAMGPLTTDNIMMPVQGNHETIGEYFYAIYALPKEAGLPEANEEHGWHFVYGNTLFIGLNSLTESIVEAQKGWLEQTLESYKDDPDITWRIAMFHHPMFSSSNHGDTVRLQTHWQPIFERFGVDLTFSGHDHNYERTVPMKNNQEVPAGQGVVYVVAGGFFSPGYSPGTSWFTVTSHHGNKNNYVVVTVDGDTLTATAYDGTGEEVLDQFEMQK